MQKNYHNFLALALAGMGLFYFSPAKSQLVVNSAVTATQMATALVGNGGVNIANITSNCATGAWGMFSNGATTTLGINSGIILTNGSSTSPWPLGNPASSFNTTNNGFPGDSWLNTYGVTTVPTYNACILEFDATPICDTIRFRYVFASEEYPEWVNTSFADAFAFFISGPGYPVGTNIAKVPIVNQTININTVNAGNFGCPGPPTGCSNCAYYINNCTCPNIVYDGRTVVMTAQAIVTPCATYHIKLSIADGSDQIYDSGVFLETGTPRSL